MSVRVGSFCKIVPNNAMLLSPYLAEKMLFKFAQILNFNKSNKEEIVQRLLYLSWNGEQ